MSTDRGDTESKLEDKQGWFYKLPEDEKTRLALAVLQRHDMRSVGLEVLRKRFPSAPEPMLSAAVFHLYVELPRALRDLLAQIELSVTKPEHGLHYGVTWEAIYHLYNWLQLEALVPGSQQHLLDHVRDLKECLGDKDMDGAAKILADIEDHLDGSISPPGFD